MAPPPIAFPSSARPLTILTQPEPFVWVLTFTGKETPDNRLTPAFIHDGVLPALDFVEEAWRDAFREGKASDGAALITVGPPGKEGKIYSNGLDFENAIKDPLFFDEELNPLLHRFLSFPIPCIAAISGHAFAGGFTVALAHDYRVMRSDRGYLCMNEIEFSAPMPSGMLAILKTKITHAPLLRKVILQAHRFDAKQALQEGLVDFLSEEPGQEGTLKKSLEVARAVRNRCAAGGWGTLKLCMYEPELKVLTTSVPNVDPFREDEKAISRLERARLIRQGKGVGSKL